MAAPTKQCSNIPGQIMPLHYHCQILMDNARMKGFRDAILRFLPEGGKALVLGGGAGASPFYAAQKAAHVWCVESNAALAASARKLMEINGCADRVEIIEADPAEFVPPEEVDVVVCEMLHAALLRERQIQVVNAFKNNYRGRFPEKLPAFVPEATFLAVQAVEQVFTFNGYAAPVPMLFNPLLNQDTTKQLSEPAVYSLLRYHQELSEKMSWKGALSINNSGTLNALRFVTKNVLAIDLEKNSTVDWHNLYLVLPLARPLPVTKGDEIAVHFEYTAGGEVSELCSSINVAPAR